MDISGQRVDRWLILGKAPNRGTIRYWLCRCDCGTERAVRQGSLRTGKSRSCGCHKSDVTSARNRRHGADRTPEHRAWVGAKQRCYRVNSQDYKDYGARGIRMADEWRDNFAQFLADMGPKPTPAHSLDRINTHGHYEPGNCRWATATEQAMNTRRNRRVTVGDRTLTYLEWSRETGLSPGILKYRFEAGWDPKRALTTPVRFHRKAC